jgi:hypothetical protein
VRGEKSEEYFIPSRAPASPHQHWAGARQGGVHRGVHAVSEWAFWGCSEVGRWESITLWYYRGITIFWGVAAEPEGGLRVRCSAS